MMDRDLSPHREEFEAWLEARGIPFDLEGAACPGAWPDMLVQFRAGRGRLEFASDDRHGEPVIRRSEVATALRRCRTVLGVRRWLAGRYPRVAPLPPIRWTDGTATLKPSGCRP